MSCTNVKFKNIKTQQNLFFTVALTFFTQALIFLTVVTITIAQSLSNRSELHMLKFCLQCLGGLRR